MIHYKMTHLRICAYQSLAKIEEAKEHFSNREDFFNKFRLMASIMSFWKIHIVTGNENSTFILMLSRLNHIGVLFSLYVCDKI